MKVLFIHQNFPGQFRHLAAHLARQQDVSVRAIGRDYAPGLQGIHLTRYRPHRGTGKETHPYARCFEEGVLHGQQVLRLLRDFKNQGWCPDLVMAHPGWGESLYVKEAFPATRLIHFCEYYYHTHGADAGFDPEFPLSAHNAAAILSRNALHLLALEQCDLGIAPTHWQHSLYPAVYHDKIKVIHEGIDVRKLGPAHAAVLPLAHGRELRAGEPIVTFVARNLEPYRGFHRFMRALPKLLDAHPTVQVVIVGGDEVSYGRRPSDAPDWRTKLVAENPIDPNRVHFLGKVPYDRYRQVLQVSSAHIYFTYPFVLSWSLLEALASACLVIASNTAPVREVIRHGENGWLVDFFDENALVEHILKALAHPPETAAMRAAARKHAQAYSIEKGIETYMNWIMRNPEAIGSG
ncbi:MAG: glycosyltransferase family 4 protein [Azoarcus sp.]|jgi:glycosyltransferase involved in cell wall biosynthesis|nr:glycosyltransferase family 4 protein [Azoarcus sp.]